MDGKHSELVDALQNIEMNSQAVGVNVPRAKLCRVCEFACSCCSAGKLGKQKVFGPARVGPCTQEQFERVDL